MTSTILAWSLVSANVMGWAPVLIALLAAALLKAIYRKRAHLGDLAGVAFLAFGVSIVITSAFVHYVTPGSALVSNNQIVASHEKGTFVWRWRKNAPEAEWVSYSASEHADVKTVFALTANPGVRKVQINLVLEVGGSPKSLAEFLGSDWRTPGQSLKDIQFSGRWKIRPEKIRSLLNRFEKIHHTWVAENCYDDTDVAQQAALRAKVEEFIAAEVAGKGIRMKTANFSLPDM